jgi:tRNA modification GTPase
VKAADGRAIVCLNKSDLKPVLSAQQIGEMTDAQILEISAQTGQGLERLMAELGRRIAVGEENNGQLTAQRHIELAQRAEESLERAVQAIEAGMPLDTAAIDIREALSTLSEITGENASEAVIDRVFENFCVGK